jgi:putative heme iron utilization protein
MILWERETDYIKIAKTQIPAQKTRALKESAQMKLNATAQPAQSALLIITHIAPQTTAATEHASRIWAKIKPAVQMTASKPKLNCLFRFL